MVKEPKPTLVSVLPEDLAARLLERPEGVQLAAGQILFSGGDAGDGCYWTLEGLLKVHALSPSGSERILALLGPGTFVGELSMLDGAPRSASVTAIRASKLQFISRARFQSLARERPDIHQHLTALLVRRLREVDDVLTASSFLPLKGRAARALLSLADAFGKDVGGGRILIHQKVSQSDLAAMAGIARENFSRILQDWSRQGWVTRLSGYYCLERRDELARENER